MSKKSEPSDFWNKLRRVESTDCWEWTGYKARFGYGSIMYQGETWLTHRLAYTLHYGSTANQCVLHRCDNPPCCNPRHLFLGTREDNVADRVAKGRCGRPAGARNGRAKIDGDTAVWIKGLCESGQPRKTVAGMYKLSLAQVGRIVRGDQWAAREGSVGV